MVKPNPILLIGRGNLQGTWASQGFWKISPKGLNQFEGKFLPSEVAQMRKDATKYIAAIEKELAEAREAQAMVEKAQTYSAEFEERLNREEREYREKAEQHNRKLRENLKNRPLREPNWRND
jgi:predicted KAP-like P-loop ATPase